MQAGYLVSSYFKDIYLFLAQNKLPSNKTAIKKVKVLAEKYILLDSLLFKIISNPDKEAIVLAILEVCSNKNNYSISFKSVCRTSGSDKDVFNNK